MEIIKPEEYAVSEWAGGKTTQLYIYPQGSEYAKRNFLLRISSATVECERSEFTSLPQVERIILPLSGSLHLFYEGCRLLCVEVNFNEKKEGRNVLFFY